MEVLIYLNLGNTSGMFLRWEAVNLEIRGGWWKSHKLSQELAESLMREWSVFQCSKENWAEGRLRGRAHEEQAQRILL